jgi:hypothetical protein
MRSKARLPHSTVELAYGLHVARQLAQSMNFDRCESMRLRCVLLMAAVMRVFKFHNPQVSATFAILRYGDGAEAHLEKLIVERLAEGDEQAVSKLQATLTAVRARRSQKN